MNISDRFLHISLTMINCWKLTNAWKIETSQISQTYTTISNYHQLADFKMWVFTNQQGGSRRSRRNLSVVAQNLSTRNWKFLILILTCIHQVLSAAAHTFYCQVRWTKCTTPHLKGQQLWLNTHKSSCCHIFDKEYVQKHFQTFPLNSMSFKSHPLKAISSLH